VEEIISTLIAGAYLGEAENAAVHICRAGDARILKVIGETKSGPPRRLSTKKPPIKAIQHHGP